MDVTTPRVDFLSNHSIEESTTYYKFSSIHIQLNKQPKSRSLEAHNTKHNTSGPLRDTLRCNGCFSHSIVRSTHTRLIASTTWTDPESQHPPHKS